MYATHDFFGSGTTTRSRSSTAGPAKAATTEPPADVVETRKDARNRPVAPAPDAERAYLRQIGRTQLLSREAEIDLGERIRSGEREIAAEALTSGPGLAWVLAIPARLERGEARVRDLVRIDGDDPAAEAAARARLVAGVARVRKMASAPVTKTRTQQARAVALRLAVAELGVEPTAVEAVIGQLGRLAGSSATVIEREAGMSAPALARLLATVRGAQEQVRAAKHVLIESNLRLVAAIARRYRNRGMEFADVLQEGNLGLMRAADRFDHRRGYRFSTCAKWWIRKAITYAIADRARTIRIPVDVVAAIEKMKMVARRLAHDLGREPEAADLAARLRLPVERVERLMRLGAGIAREPISLEVSSGDDDDRTLGDTIEDAAAVGPLDGACASRMRDEARDALSLLDDRERLVLKLRFGIEARSDHTLEEIGGHLSVTRERVRQIEAKALAKLRRSEFAPTLRASVEA